MKKLDINKEDLLVLIASGYTNEKLAVWYDCSRATIANRKKEFGISKTNTKHDMNSTTRTCSMCNIIKDINEFSKQGKYYASACKTCSLARRRIKRYSKLKNCLDKQNRVYVCENCGYDKNYAALQFHHRTEEKNFEIGNYLQSIPIEELEYELSICKVLCANCHAEEHNPNHTKEQMI